MNKTTMRNRQEFIEMATALYGEAQVEQWLADIRRRETINALCAGGK